MSCVNRQNLPSGFQLPREIAMSSKLLTKFLRDERGSYTLWSLAWFVLLTGIVGLSVDITDAFRNQALLQSAADSAAVAAVMSLHEPDEEPVAMANAYAAANMNQTHNGDVLADADIAIGHWDFTNRIFTAGGTPENAVRVITRRSVANANPVVMSFLRILQLFGFDPIWNVAAEAIAARGSPTCFSQGLIAGNQVSQSTQNGFYEFMCVHGVNGLKVTNDNYFELGVSVGTTCADCVEPSGVEDAIASNDGFREAWEIGGPNQTLDPMNAYLAADYIEALKALPDTGGYYDMLNTYGENYSGWHYLFHPDGSAPSRYTGTSLPAQLQPYTVYDIDCGSQLDLPSTPMRNVAIIADCKVHVSSNQTVDMRDVAIAVDWYPSNKSNQGMHFSAGGNIGNTECKGGGVELYTNGSSIHFAASGNVKKVRLISAWDIDWAAQANGRIGIAGEAVNDIVIRSQSQFGLCGSQIFGGPQQYTYRLVF